ncbi:MAG: RNA 3'-terminal phosphate cyclase [Nitrososphaeraceae archaeon]
MLKINGNYGEGGGQILRTSVALSAVLQKPVKIYNIRSKRSKPGIRPQHFYVVKTLADIFNAKVENLYVGSESIVFRPSKKIGEKSYFNDLKINIGSAGSIPLILQTIIPTISIAKKYVSIKIIGGTDVPYSPTIDYIRYVVAKIYRIIGINSEIKVLRRGYYPIGNGIVHTKIFPCENIGIIDLINKRRKIEPRIIGVASNIPKKIIYKQILSGLLQLEKNGIQCNNYQVSCERSTSSGFSILVFTQSECGPFIGGDAINDKKNSIMNIGIKATEKFLENYLSNNVSIDYYLADMLVIPASLAKGKSRYCIKKVTQHLITNLYIASKIVGCKYTIKDKKKYYIVTIEGNSDQDIKK